MQIPGYKIIRKINSGGMASVYLAIQLSIGRTVALKIMKPALDQDPEFHQRFQREAEITGQLSQPNIIPIYDIGRHEGFNYISMEYLPEGSLEQKISAGISPDKALQITKGIAAALEHAHAKGYVHRDIKPENILFRADNTPVLTDFGIARALKRKSTMTQVGAVIGTPYYMSPEQAKGQATDGRSDLYSLGVVLYEMLTGEKLFHAEDSLSLGIKHIQEQPPALPLRIFAWQAILDKLLAKDPAKRFQQPRELITALERLGDNLSPLGDSQHNHHSLQLFKAILQLLLKDSRSYAMSILSGSLRLYHKHTGTKATEAVITPLANTQLTHAQTAITSVIQVPAKKHFWQRPSLYVYVTMGLLALIAAANFSGSQNTTRGNWAALVGKEPSRILAAPAPKAAVVTREKTDKNSSALPVAKQFPLTIQAAPLSARIRILNIKEKYSPAILLTPGNYQVEVSAPGYSTYNDWVTLNADRQDIHIKLQPKTKSAEDLLTPELIYITAANFLMGDASQAEHKPLTKVFLRKNYYIGQFEVTFDEYDYFAVATNRNLPNDEGWGRGRRPVINVSWDDAQAYVNWLSKTTGATYRLPRSAEWEFAARGKTTGRFWWGNNTQDALGRANCQGDCKPLMENLLSGIFSASTDVVGSYPPNDWELYDTAGNVAEWVEDCAEDNLGDNLQCTTRIIRGGSFMDDTPHIASHAQTGEPQAYSDKTIGFRVLKEEPLQQNIFQKIFRNNPFR